MGTNRRYSGEISIDPPLDWEAIRRVQALPRIVHGWEVKLVIDESKQDTKTGEMIVKTCSEIVPWTEEAYRGYYVREAVQDIIDACPDVLFGGHLEGVLEDASEMWRLVIQDGRKVVEVKPKITWPDP